MQTPTPEEFILSHANLRVYDPVKAHEYYLRTRKLKGRKKGLAIPVKPNAGNTTRPSALNPKQTKAQAQLISVVRQNQSEARVKARVEELKSKLNVLKAILNQLVKDALTSTPKKTPKDSAATKSTSDNKDRKALTGAQKADKAKKAKIQYQKDHPESEKQARQRQIKEVQAKIQEVESKLKDALESARKLSTQKTPA